MGFLDSVLDTLTGFSDTIFYKEDSDLQSRFDALKQLNEEYPNNEELLSEFNFLPGYYTGKGNISKEYIKK